MNSVPGCRLVKRLNCSRCAEGADIIDEIIVSGVGDAEGESVIADVDYVAVMKFSSKYLSGTKIVKLDEGLSIDLGNVLSVTIDDVVLTLVHEDSAVNARNGTVIGKSDVVKGISADCERSGNGIACTILLDLDGSEVLNDHLFGFFGDLSVAGVQRTDGTGSFHCAVQVKVVNFIRSRSFMSVFNVLVDE